MRRWQIHFEGKWSFAGSRISYYTKKKGVNESRMNETTANCYNIANGLPLVWETLSSAVLCWKDMLTCPSRARWALIRSVFLKATTLEVVDAVNWLVGTVLSSFMQSLRNTSSREVSLCLPSRFSGDSSTSKRPERIIPI